MKKNTLRFRQVHLDYHTSEKIPGIGKKFNKEHYQETLLKAHVDSVTTFSTCHHGWTYHPTKKGEIHPHLTFDLLKAQIDACHEVDINVPVYITAGVNNRIAILHPEWREIDSQGQYAGWVKSPLKAGFQKLCFNTPYLDYLCGLIEEVVDSYPEGDGIFLDIISQGECCCPSCLKSMEEAGLNPRSQQDRQEMARRVLETYYRRTTEVVQRRNPERPIFHNSGNIAKGNRDILPYFTHFEMESLPTGGWGYDHFPGSVKYVHNLGKDYLGMTGKFHTTWGEFGGIKHPNALRYECAAMLAFGARCSIGDQLPPEGLLDETTYRNIGAAYEEVKAKETWCRDARQISDVAVLSLASILKDESHRYVNESDAGASRMLLEENILFDIVDGEEDFTRYQVLILPDAVPVSPGLKEKIDNYLTSGGALFLTGSSGLDDAGQPLWDCGADFSGESPFQPDFLLPHPELRPDWLTTPMVMYEKSQRIRVTDGENLGSVYDPYFNRAYNHFCSHQHAPARPEPSSFSGGVRKGSLLYLAHPVFRLYRNFGSFVTRDYAMKALKSILKSPSLTTNLPSTGRASLTRTAEGAYVAHLLYGPTVKRGDNPVIGNGEAEEETVSIEVIEDLPLLGGVEITLNVPEEILKVTLEPQGEILNLPENRKKVAVPPFSCHQMVIFHFN